MASGKQEHMEQITERCLIAQKKSSFEERAERDWKYWCKRCQRVYRQFSAPSAWVFVFNLCLENFFNENSRVTCNKSPHSLVPRSCGFLTQTTRAYNPVRRTFYDVNYMNWFQSSEYYFKKCPYLFKKLSCWYRITFNSGFNSAIQRQYWTIIFTTIKEFEVC